MSHHDSSSSIIFIVAAVVWGMLSAARTGKRISRRREPQQSIESTGNSGSLGFISWFLSLFTLFKKPDAAALERAAASEARQVEIIKAIKKNKVPKSMQERLGASRDGTSPWISTLSPAEMLITRSHGIRPIAAVSATCWMQYGYSWTKGHEKGWETALKRLKEEAKACGANAVLDVKMRTIPIYIGSSMDFSLVGTAVKVDGLPPSEDPIVATVPALEFVKLLEAGIVPVSIAIGAEFRWINDWRRATNLMFAGNMESTVLTNHWKHVRDKAFYNLREDVKKMGTGALAYVNFSQMFEQEGQNDARSYLARHIVIATVVDAPPLPEWAMNRFPEIMGERLPPMQMVLDLHAGKTPLTRKTIHHQSYGSNQEEGPI